MASVTIAELVRNGTMSAEMAAVLWAAVDEQVSFLTVALPRLAGKSTTSQAILALRPEHVPVHNVAGEPTQMQRLQQEQLGGYLVVNEFSKAPIPGYIWGEPVRRVFETLPYGYALQTSLHADGIEEGMTAVTRGNGVSDEDASAFKLILYIERFGSGSDGYWRRLTELFEVQTVENGRPIGQPLFRWRSATDDFEQLSEPRQFGHEAGGLARRAATISRLAESGQTSTGDVMAAVSRFRSHPV